MTFALRPMTQDEYDAWLDHVIEDYAAELVKAGRAAPEGAVAESARQFRQLLPDGVDSERQLLFTGVDGGERVGVIWVSLPGTPSHPDTAWVYNVEVDPAQRGKGYGRALMRGAEAELAARGVTKIGLNVFGGNTTAIRLYESLGYQVTAQQMSKPITPA